MEVDEDTEENVETLGVRTFLASRIQEINSLSHQISTSGVPTCKGLAFQHVPKHMRRRAVSHNPKRLPKRLQEIHVSQVTKSAGSIAKKPKTPSRRHRRRPSNLLEEYNRRQKEHKWMETHIWHAKRYFMENKWGYKMPISPTDKGYRACYKAAVRHCVMRDISFYSCLQLDGPFDLIVSTIFKSLAPKEANPLSLSATLYKSGEREGSLHFYKSGGYPFKFIGKVRFHWKLNNQSEPDCLFLWVHPTQKEEIVNELCTEFELLVKLEFPKEQTNQKETIQDAKLKPKKLFNRQKWINYTTNVTLTDLEGVFNRFRFYGPLTTTTFKEVLIPLTSSKLKQAKESDLEKFWWTSYYSTDTNERKQLNCEFWNKLHDISQIPCNSIIPLTVNDPRISIPKTRIPIITKNGENLEKFDKKLLCMENLQFSFNFSPLLDETIRTRLVNEKMSQQEFDTRRSKLLIPGSKLDLGVEENQVPLLLVHRPSTNNSSFQNGGWDLVIPAGWAMPFWIAFVYRAVRVAGLRESIHFEFETGSILSASTEDGFLPPDSLAGNKYADEMFCQNKSNYFKYPPAKRSSLIKFKCPFPFKINWKLLLQHCNGNEQNVESCFVLRNLVHLQKLKSAILIPSPSEGNPEADLSLFSLPHFENCLIGVRLTIFGKGTIEEGAVICIPTENDVVEYFNNNSKSGLHLEESMGDDSEYRNKREELQQQKAKMKRFLQEKRRKLRKRALKEEDVDVSPFSSDILELLNEKMDNLWLPESVSVLKSMTRFPIGFIVFGHESYAIGKCSGLGYCAYKGIERWIKSAKCSWNPKRLVIVRNCKDCLVYRFATLQLCTL